MSNPEKKQSLVLVGMPGAGKSTLGVLLAKELGKEFVDTDILIQTREQKTLQLILDETDYLNLRRIEQEVLLELDPRNKVIATGGSAVYSEAGMMHLKRFAHVIFLDLPLQQIRRRIHNFHSRGIASAPEQSLAQLFAERRELYRRYADIQMNCRHKSVQQLVSQLLDRFNEGAL